MCVYYSFVHFRSEEYVYKSKWSYAYMCVCMVTSNSYACLYGIAVMEKKIVSTR